MERPSVVCGVSFASGREGIYICGLIAGTGHIKARYIAALGCLAESRGHDSAGVAWQAQGRLKVAKVAKNPLVAYPVDLSPALRHAEKHGAPLIGHTRQATQGAVTDRNAHPFTDLTGTVAWAHNGIIFNYKEFGEYEVDSECLLHGIEARDFSKFRGPIALVWIEDGKLHAYRKGNPLFRGKKQNAVYLASTKDMLDAIRCKKVVELTEGNIYSWAGEKLLEPVKVPSSADSTYGCRPAGGYSGRSWSDYEEYDYSFMFGDQWHNHPSSVVWSYMCIGCKTSREWDSEIADAEKEEKGLVSQLCTKCNEHVHVQGTLWCRGCLDEVRHGH